MKTFSPLTGGDYFALSSYFGHDNPIVGYRYGPALSPDLRGLLNSVTAQTGS